MYEVINEFVSWYNDIEVSKRQVAGLVCLGTMYLLAIVNCVINPMPEFRLDSLED